MVKFIGTCVELSARHLEDYDVTEREITAKTFRKHVGPEVYRELERRLGYDKHLRLADDYAVSFGKGKWRGKPAVCLRWSSIHHIYLV